MTFDAYAMQKNGLLEFVGGDLSADSARETVERQAQRKQQRDKAAAQWQGDRFVILNWPDSEKTVIGFIEETPKYPVRTDARET